MPISQPSGIVRLNPDGTLNASGWMDNTEQLQAVWGAVFPGVITSLPENPWNSNVVNRVQGTVTYDQPSTRYLWEVKNIPGARGKCQEDSFVVWYLFENKECFASEWTLFIGDSTGSGCSGSGSGSGGSGSGGSGSGGSGSGGSGGSGGGGGGAFPFNALMADMFPRYYRVAPADVNPDQATARRADGDRANPGEIVLQYDEANSTPVTMGWRSVNPDGPDNEWHLRVTIAGAVLRRGGPRQDAPQQMPDVWENDAFTFFNPNLMKARTTGLQTPRQPRALRLEPVI